MTLPLIAGLLALASPAARPASVPDALADEGTEYAQVYFHSRIVIRVQTGPVAQTPMRWTEKKGPKCVTMADIAGSAVMAPNSVDIVLRGGDRVRAKFEAKCPGLDYYSGFYIVPPADGKFCADRDVVRDRAGSECAIDKFRKLVPKK